jgi:hypothetical protein
VHSKERKRRTTMRNIQAFILVAVICTISSVQAATQQSEHPTQVLQIAKNLKALLASEQDAFLTVSEGATRRIVQVGFFTVAGKKTLSLNIAHYPSQKEPKEVFPAIGIKIPNTWSQTGFEADAFVAYDIPRNDAKYLPYMIHNVFLTFFKSDPDYKLATGVELVAPEPEIDFDPSQVKIEVSAGNKPSADEADVDGQTISFLGINSKTELNGKITDARVANTEDNMKQYAVVLDVKGVAFAAANGLLQVTGKVRIQNGKRMLTVTDFHEKQF